MKMSVKLGSGFSSSLGLHSSYVILHDPFDLPLLLSVHTQSQKLAGTTESLGLTASQKDRDFQYNSLIFTFHVPIAGESGLMDKKT